MESHDAGVGMRGIDPEHVLERHPGGVVHLGTGPGVVEQAFGHERRRPHDDVGGGEAVAAAQSDEVGGSRTGADERDHGRPAGGTSTVAR